MGFTSAMHASPDWVAARQAMMLDATVTNLNTGSFGPLPRCVFDHVTELRRHLAAEPMDFLVRKLPPLLWHARTRLAEYLHGDPFRLIFTANVSSSINLIASSLRLAHPGEILLTDHEYGAMHWCWERAAQRQGLSLRTFALPTSPADPEEIVQAAVRTFSHKTRLLFFSHVLSPTGMVLPAQRLCEEAKKRGILTVVDGAHAPAMIDVNLGHLAADYYGANCHKWMLAPTGSGFLHFGPGAMERLQPMQVSWGWHPDTSKMDDRDEFGSTPRLRFLEFEGTRDPCPWLAVPTAIDLQAHIGVAAIRSRMTELANYVRQQLQFLPEVTPDHPALRGSLTARRLPEGIDPVKTRRWLWDRYRIEAPVIERPDGILIRASTHFYNTHEEIDRLADAMLHLDEA